MDNAELARRIESLLFYKVEPMNVETLSEALEVSKESIAKALQNLEETLAGRGIQLLRKQDSVTLATAPESASLIERFRRQELEQDIGKAALETLTIVLYHGPVTRADIDYIRGVNSTFTLRNLLMRGLIERIHNLKDQRSYLYQPTVALLGHLGVTAIEDLPEFAVVKRELTQFEQELTEEKNEI